MFEMWKQKYHNQKWRGNLQRLWIANRQTTECIHKPIFKSKKLKPNPKVWKKIVFPKLRMCPVGVGVNGVKPNEIPPMNPEGDEGNETQVPEQSFAIKINYN